MSLISLPRLEFLALIPDTDTGLGDTASGQVTITITMSPLPQGYYTLDTLLQFTVLLTLSHPLYIATCPMYQLPVTSSSVGCVVNATLQYITIHYNTAPVTMQNSWGQ